MMPTPALRKVLVLFCVALLYMATRIGGVTASFYQDELDWVIGIVRGQVSIPHPPVSALVYKAGAFLFGEQLLRLTPFLLGLAALGMLWLVVKHRAGQRAAAWAVAFSLFSFYAAFASLVIDTDGQWLPLLFLAVLFAFDRWHREPQRAKRLRWAVLGTAILIIGLSTKLSFSIAAGTLGIEYLLGQRARWKEVKFWLSLAGYCAGVLALVVLGIKAGRFLLPEYSVQTFTSYTARFFTLHRGWLQILIQFVKAILYLSPALVMLPLFLPRQRWTALRPFIVFLFLNLLFYLVLFDFSAAALDRYLMALIVPLCALAGAAIAETVGPRMIRRRTLIIAGTLAAGGIAMQFLPHEILPHYPKTAWFGRVLSGRWAFLMPFSGGSGPMGFYVSWISIGYAWAISALLVVLARIRKAYLPLAVVSVVAISVVYGAIFIEESQYGMIHGSAHRLLRQAIRVIESDDSVQRVITYNDIGAYELMALGKYERRFYAAPKFEDSYEKILREFRGHWLIIDVPHISVDSAYGKFFAACDTVWYQKDGVITAALYQCDNR